MTTSQLKNTKIIVVPSINDAQGINPLPIPNWENVFASFKHRILFLSNPSEI